MMIPDQFIRICKQLFVPLEKGGDGFKLNELGAVIEQSEDVWLTQISKQ